jgi:hypothetical protein
VFSAFAAGLTYVLHEGFAWYAASLAEQHADTIHVVRPGSTFWYAPASVLGVIVAWKMVYSGLSFQLPRRIRVLSMLLAFGSVVLTYFAAHSYLRMTQHEIVMRRLWSVSEERRPYSEVKALKEVSHPGDDNIDFVIEFYDAPEWTTAVEIVFPDEGQKMFLSARSGKPVERVTAP